MPIPEAPFRICADACLAYSTPLLGRVAAVKQALSLYRIHGSNVHARLGTHKQNRRHTDVDRVERYRLIVEGANQVLAGLGRAERFRLQDHISYVTTKYLSNTADRPSWAAVSWKLARMSSQPSQFIRFKELAKFWLGSLGMRQFS